MNDIDVLLLKEYFVTESSRAIIYEQVINISYYFPESLCKHLHFTHVSISSNFVHNEGFFSTVFSQYELTPGAFFLTV